MVLNKRKENILKIIVGDHIATAFPVGSASIVRRYNLPISPATVRNEMAILEGEGYILRPHTSAGAVPSDRGYRYYVESLIEPPTIPLEVKVKTRRRFNKVKKDLEAWTCLAAELLAQLSSNMAVASFPRRPRSRLRHLQLVSLQELLVLLVLVLQEARLRKELLPLKEPVSQEELITCSNKLNEYLSGLSRQEISGKQLELSPFEKMVVERTKEMMKEEDRAAYLDFYIEGLKQLVSQPEFTGEKARGVVEVLEDRHVLGVVLNEAVEGQGLRIIIGKENKEEPLRPFSVILQAYGIAGEISGTIGVVGPTRMDYSRVIADVSYISSIMSEMMEEVLSRSN